MHLLRTTALCTVLLACEPPASPDCAAGPGRVVQSIKVEDTGALKALESWERGLLRLEIDVPVHGMLVQRTCTAARIAPGVALTARHCFARTASATVRVYGTSAPAEDRDCSGREPATVLEHPSLDLSLVLFADDDPSSSLMLVTNIPETGTGALLAGYGLTESGTYGELRAIAAEVLATSEQTIVVQGQGGGACLGDSGGPLIVEIGDTFALAGTLSRGSASCLGQDEYVPISAARAWLEGEVTGLVWHARQ